MPRSDTVSRLAASEALRSNIGASSRIATAITACVILVAWVDWRVLLVWLSLVVAQDLLFVPWVQGRWVLPAESRNSRRAEDAAFVTLVTGTVIYGAMAPIAWLMGGDVGRLLAILWLYSSVLHAAVYYAHQRRGVIVTAGPSLLLMIILPVMTEGVTWSAAAMAIVMLQVVGICSAAFFQRRSLLAKVDAFRQAKDEADEANTAKSRFIAVMSHELRTPINAITGYADLIKEEMASRGDTDVEEDADRILASAHKLLGLVQDILVLSNFEIGVVPTRPVETDVQTLVLDVAEGAKSLAIEQATAIDVYVESPLAKIHTDPAHLRRCLAILLGNACKFTHGGVVTLTARAHANAGVAGIEFLVSDTGIGMDDDQVAKLFEPFVQGDNSATRKYQGAGLGLAVAKRLSVLLGGDIKVTSKLGSGSTFALVVPAT